MSETTLALITQSVLHDIGDSIRAKLDVETLYLPSQMSEAIDNIPTGGGGALSWNDNFAINWDFSDPVNTRGSSQYVSTNSVVVSINGWKLWQTTLDVVTGGVVLTSGANVFQTINSSILAQLVGKQCTLSILAGNVCESVTFTFNSSIGMQAELTCQNGARAWSYRDSATVCSVSFGFIGSGACPTIQAIKLELGSTQTLAHQENGVWVKNNGTSKTQETVKGAALLSDW